MRQFYTISDKSQELDIHGNLLRLLYGILYHVGSSTLKLLENRGKVTCKSCIEIAFISRIFLPFPNVPRLQSRCSL